MANPFTPTGAFNVDRLSCERLGVNESPNAYTTISCDTDTYAGKQAGSGAVRIGMYAAFGTDQVYFTNDTGDWDDGPPTTRAYMASGGINYYVFEQAAQPSESSKMIIWKDTDDSDRIYLIWDSVKVELQ